MRIKILATGPRFTGSGYVLVLCEDWLGGLSGFAGAALVVSTTDFSMMARIRYLGSQAYDGAPHCFLHCFLLFLFHKTAEKAA